MNPIITILSILLFTNIVMADIIEPDKQLHVGVSFAISAFTYGVLRDSGKTKFQSAVGAIGLTLMIGLSKEIYDSQQPNNFFDKQDLLYDGIGAIGAPLFMIWSFE